MKKETWFMLHQEKVGFIAEVSTTKTVCINNSSKNMGEKWETMKKNGYSVQKVFITPIPRKKRTKKKKQGERNEI